MAMVFRGLLCDTLTAAVFSERYAVMDERNKRTATHFYRTHSQSCIRVLNFQARKQITRELDPKYTASC